MSPDISDLGAADLGRMYERGCLSPVDVVLASLDRAERYSELNVFVNPPDRERILAEARQSEARWRNNSAVGRLDGAPITVKDTILTKRLPTWQDQHLSIRASSGTRMRRQSPDCVKKGQSYSVRQRLRSSAGRVSRTRS
jgi:hypothetical protein